MSSPKKLQSFMDSLTENTENMSLDSPNTRLPSTRKPSNTTVDPPSEPTKPRRVLGELPNTNSRPINRSPSKADYTSKGVSDTSFAEKETPTTYLLDEEPKSDLESDDEFDSDDETYAEGPSTKYNFVDWDALETELEKPDADDLRTGNNFAEANWDTESEEEQDAIDQLTENTSHEVDWDYELIKYDAHQELTTEIAANVPKEDLERKIRCVFDVASQTFTYSTNPIPLVQIADSECCLPIKHLETAPVVGGAKPSPYFDYSKDTLSIEYGLCGEEGSHDEAIREILSDLREDDNAKTKLRHLEFQFCFRTASALDVADTLDERDENRDRIFKTLESLVLTCHDHTACWEFDDEDIIYNQAAALGLGMWGTNEYPFKVEVGWLQNFAL